MNAPAEDAVEGAAAFLGAAAAMRRTTRLTIVCRVCQVERVESSRVGSGRGDGDGDVDGSNRSSNRCSIISLGSSKASSDGDSL